ncbi:uncharacterized protein LOC143355597 [Halictus rubicundus]|uniref:uncharacterized protein LOC143355597 n=1 Tax=Halictus rubicundus TaxID=77578 RepID=UPI004035C6F2
MKIERENNYEIEDLKSKLHNCKYLINQLKQDLSKKCESCYLHSKEIEKLKLYAEEASTLKFEQELLLQKLQKMEELSEKVEKYELALSRSKKVQHEKDCILADQEKEIKQLLALINKTTVTYEEQENTKRMIGSLETEICEKNMKISQYEQQLASMKRETSEFVNNLKHALNNLEEFNGFCEDVYNCMNFNLDITEEANHLLYNINVMMTRFQSYKIERQNLLQQIENLKHSVEDDKHQIYFNQGLRNMISDILNCETEVDTRNTDRKDSIIVFNVRQNKCNWNEIECEDISNSVNSEHSSNGMTDNEYNNYIIKLSRKNSINEIDKEILEYFSHFILKLHVLTKKLQVYLEVERPLMIKQIYNFYEMLQETESAINDSQDLALKKERISELSVLLNERRTKYETYMTQLPNDLSQIQIKIIEFIKTILDQLLNAILYVEKNNLSNKRIDEVFKSYFQSYTSSMRAAIQGAGDQRAQILEKIEKQHQELQKKNEEIVELKEEVAQYVRRGEGDSIRAAEKNALLKEQLANVAIELRAKDESILHLEEQKGALKIELSKSKEDCNTLKLQNKNYEKELEIKTTQLKESLKNMDTAANEKLKIQMEFLKLQTENKDLKNQIMLAKKTIAKNDDRLKQLCSDINKEVLEHKNEIEEKCREIKSLNDENNLLNKKLRNAENKLSEMNQTILSLNEQNDKIDIIYSLQEDFAKLDKNEKKLKIEINHLKTQLVNEQNKTKKIDSNLSAYERKNENLKKNVEYWKNQNSELSLKRYTEAVEEKLRNKLYTLSTKIHESILNFNKLFDLEEHVSNNKQPDENLKDEYLKYQNINEKLKSSENQKKEMKENEIEEVQNQQLCNSTNVECKILNGNYAMFQELNLLDDDGLNVHYEMKHLETRDKDYQSEPQKLLRQIEMKDSEIRDLQDAISRLKQENTNLCIDLKSQTEQYQDKITLMKKNYDSSLNKFRVWHEKYVDILQKRFEDNMNNEKTFDSKNWLQSLDMKELTELYERITMIMDNNSNFIQMKAEDQRFYENNVHKEFYEINETQRHRNIYETEVPNKLDSTVLRDENNSYVRNQWQFIFSSQTAKYSVQQTQNYKLSLEEDYGCVDDRKIPELESKCEQEKQRVKDSTFDQQRWNFINQCSVYHKMSNNYDCPKSIHTD